MRTDRQPDAQSDNPHALILSLPGRNRFQRGTHVCKCSRVFTSINAWEAHKAEARRSPDGEAQRDRSVS